VARLPLGDAGHVVSKAPRQPRPQGITKTTLRKAAADERAHARTLQATKKAAKMGTAFDAFNNWSINLGLGTNNALSGGTYGFNPITRIRTLLEWMYRGNWLSQVAIDQVAKDMTREGFTIKAAKDEEQSNSRQPPPMPQATMGQGQDFAPPKDDPKPKTKGKKKADPSSGETTPADLQRIYVRMARTQVTTSLCDAIKWGRLYGGACAFIQIKGADPATPLRIEAIGKGSFTGLTVFDRWMLEPQLGDLVQEGPEVGLPRFYKVTGDAPGLKGRLIHHSRMIRFIGVKLPYWQAMSEQFWGVSIFEPLYDRMVAFDSATMGAAQLAYKAHVRTLKIKGYRNILATGGGPSYLGLMRSLELVRTGQSVEGLTVIDGDDDMTTQTATMTGIAEIILKLGEQISGGLQTPLTKLFGQAPAGLNSTGEGDNRNYYDGIKQKQSDEMGEPMHMLSRVIAMSEGVDLGEEFEIEFNPLWQMSDKERGEVDKINTESVLAVEESGNVSQRQMLMELKHRGRATNTWQTSITEKDIEDADDELPSPEDLGIGGPGSGEEAFGPEGQPEGPVAKPGGALRKALKGGGDSRGLWAVPAHDDLHIRSLGGVPIVLEHQAGEQRWPGAPRLPAAYGYIPGVGSAEGSTEWMDCMVGPDADAPYAWVIDHHRPDGSFEEHKVMLGFARIEDAIRAHRGAYAGTGCRGHGCVQMSMTALQEWMARPRNQVRPIMSAVDVRRAA
jgi:phage-related protein (TIGR01555 family)